MDDSGQVVEPAVPEFLGHVDTGGRRANRLDFANWIVSRENPLTARVFVNRLWQQFFGTGLSKVLNDVGSQGEWPSHFELLDWLAAEFMEPTWQAEGAHAWDVKHIIRTIVTSYTYRQSSMDNPQLDERDPDNRLIARQTPVRVDAGSRPRYRASVSGLLLRNLEGPASSRISLRLLGRDQFPQARICGEPGRGSVPSWRLHPLAAHALHPVWLR
jgi:hypothetical protein